MTTPGAAEKKPAQAMLFVGFAYKKVLPAFLSLVQKQKHPLHGFYSGRFPGSPGFPRINHSCKLEDLLVV
jgi:hypothetical protein